MYGSPVLVIDYYRGHRQRRVVLTHAPANPTPYDRIVDRAMVEAGIGLDDRGLEVTVLFSPSSETACGPR